MNRIYILITITMCLILNNQAHAQRTLPGMQSIRINGGFVDGVRFENNRENLGYYIGVSLDQYTKKGNRWVFGSEYLQKYYPYKDIRIPVAIFTGEGGYYYNFLTDNRKTFFFSLGGSALAGYETSNWGDKLLFDGSTLKDSNSFVYGGAMTLEIENYINDRLILFLNARERVLFGSSIGKFHFQFGAGVKFIIR